MSRSKSWPCDSEGRTCPLVCTIDANNGIIDSAFLWEEGGGGGGVVCRDSKRTAFPPGEHCLNGIAFKHSWAEHQNLFRGVHRGGGEGGLPPPPPPPKLTPAGLN